MRRPTEPRQRVWMLTGAPSDIHVDAGRVDRSRAQRAEDIIRAEVDRVGQGFSTDDSNSLLSRWIDDASVTTSGEFEDLLATASMWQRSSRGAFSVSTRRLRKLWEQAASDGCRPSSVELHELAIEIAEPPYRFDGHVLRQLRNCRELDLSAIAEGYAIDVAFDAAFRRCDLSHLTVSSCDKIVHRGPADIEVDVGALEDRNGASPAFTLRNSAVSLRLSDCPESSMGGQRVAAEVFDPRTALQVKRGVSVAVVAPDATTADAVATIVSILKPGPGLDFVDALNSAGRTKHPSERPTAAFGAIQCWTLDDQSILRHTGPD